jgi:hypothetical protein
MDQSTGPARLYLLYDETAMAYGSLSVFTIVTFPELPR